jgi:NAD(P)-dependent dehydrogenase (short-subunit alcohol dehydrogenase family)
MPRRPFQQLGAGHNLTTSSKIEGSVVVITGASSGIGREAALLFAGRGAQAWLAIAPRAQRLSQNSVQGVLRQPPSLRWFEAQLSGPPRLGVRQDLGGSSGSLFRDR